MGVLGKWVRYPNSMPLIQLFPQQMFKKIQPDHFDMLWSW